MNIVNLYTEIEKIVDQNPMVDLFGAGTFEETHFTFDKIGLWLLRADKPTKDGYKIDCLVVGSATQPMQSFENYEKNFGIVLSTGRKIIDSLRRSLEKNTKIGKVTFTPLIVENETYGVGIVGYSFEMNIGLPREKFKPTVKAKADEPAFDPDDPTYSMSTPVGFPPTTTYSLKIAGTYYSLGTPTSVAEYRTAVEAALATAGATFNTVETTEFTPQFQSSTTITNCSMVVEALRDDNNSSEIAFTAS